MCSSLYYLPPVWSTHQLAALNHTESDKLMVLNCSHFYNTRLNFWILPLYASFTDPFLNAPELYHPVKSCNSCDKCNCLKVLISPFLQCWDKSLQVVQQVTSCYILCCCSFILAPSGVIFQWWWCSCHNYWVLSCFGAHNLCYWINTFTNEAISRWHKTSSCDITSQSGQAVTSPQPLPLIAC